MRSFVLGLISVLMLVTPARAQDDVQLWTALSVNGPLGDDDNRFLLWFDAHARYSEDVSRLGVSIIRPGVGYKVNNRLSVWLGYANVLSRADGRDTLTDNRIWQQATYTLARGPWGSISGRTRLEQRFLEAGDDTAHRIRQTFRISKPLPNSKWTLTAWNETFIHLNDTDSGIEAGYNQNRAFVGANVALSKKIKLEGGYLYNNIRRVGAPDSNNNNISIALSAKL